jgi:hypothetical protein
LNVATQFFHDTGELKYYGFDKKNDESSHSDMKLLKDTVFPNPFWIIDVLRGTIRHDQDHVIKLVEDAYIKKEISKLEKDSLRGQVQRLMQKGECIYILYTIDLYVYT